MVSVRREIEIATDAEVIYRIVMDPRRLADWVTIHEQLERAPQGSLRKGSKLTQALRLAGKRFVVHWTVVENERAKRVVWEGCGPIRSRARVVYEFEPNACGTHFSYSNEYALPGGPLGRMAGPAVKRITTGELDRSLERLKLIAERGT